MRGGGRLVWCQASGHEKSANAARLTPRGWAPEGEIFIGDGRDVVWRGQTPGLWSLDGRPGDVPALHAAHVTTLGGGSHDAEETCETQGEQKHSREDSSAGYITRDTRHEDIKSRPRYGCSNGLHTMRKDAAIHASNRCPLVRGVTSARLSFGAQVSPLRCHRLAPHPAQVAAPALHRPGPPALQQPGTLPLAAVEPAPFFPSASHGTCAGVGPRPESAQAPASTSEPPSRNYGTRRGRLR